MVKTCPPNGQLKHAMKVKQARANALPTDPALLLLSAHKVLLKRRWEVAALLDHAPRLLVRAKALIKGAEARVRAQHVGLDKGERVQRRVFRASETRTMVCCQGGHRA